MFREISDRTAMLISQWMSVGFVHGVMNTDNMSLLGLTIDYGPYGWLDIVDSGWTPNTSDNNRRRYAFGSQPNVGAWNLMKLAEALYPLVGETESLQEGSGCIQTNFSRTVHRYSIQKMKLAVVTNVIRKKCCCESTLRYHGTYRNRFYHPVSTYKWIDDRGFDTTR